jgi:hypothetical protein
MVCRVKGEVCGDSTDLEDNDKEGEIGFRGHMSTLSHMRAMDRIGKYRYLRHTKTKCVGGLGGCVSQKLNSEKVLFTHQMLVFFRPFLCFLS